MLLTTVEVRIQKRAIKLELRSGDNLYEKVREFCFRYKLSEHCERMFDELYIRLTSYKQGKKSPAKQLASSPDLRSTKRRPHCCDDAKPNLTHSPKINKNYSIETLPFNSRINQRQIIHKQHEQRHSPRAKDEPTFTPSINRSYSKPLSPFKERLNLKQLVHKDHAQRHLDWSEMKNASQIKTKRRKSINESDDEQIEVIHYKPHELIDLKQPEPIIPQYGIITDGEQLHLKVKSVYGRIKDLYTTQETFDKLIFLYRTMLNTQEYRNVLRLNKLNFELLDCDQITLLERLQFKYHIAFHVEIPKQCFLVLMLSLTDLTRPAGLQVKKLIDYNYPFNYLKFV